MGTGYLKVKTSTAGGNLPVQSQITILNGDEVLYILQTNKSGIAETVALEAPPKDLAMDPDFTGIPYSTYSVKAEAQGFRAVFIYRVQIFDTITSILPIDMVIDWEHTEKQEYYIPVHKLIDPPRHHSKETAAAQVNEGANLDSAPKHGIKEVIIPYYITIRQSPAQDNAIEIPFVDYIKKIASHSIFPNWPPAAIEANIYAITSFALNRVNDAPGKNFFVIPGLNRNPICFDKDGGIPGQARDDRGAELRNSEQGYMDVGHTFQNIDAMIDQIFNRYVRREKHNDPLLTEYSDGRHITCPGLWQWGSVDLANRGYNALEILRHYYPKDVQIVETDNISGVKIPYPGYPLQEGMGGEYVHILQGMLNHMRNNFPEIPEITENNFGPETTAAVRAFQGIHVLGLETPTGVMDKSTWHHISLIFSSINRQTPPIEITHIEDANHCDSHFSQENMQQSPPASSKPARNVPINQLLTMFLISQMTNWDYI